ncbi:hypothetical protein C2G38_2101818 [Gigaspora rosea]|uniref:Uncharacterized protein n=1 Tax=Gigaspora rosea TaxID=44941 RepID=A0A397UPK0_9GLOM|nr:hypothetical protein C2G38_2101818 [Gigaspora rosea]
MAKLKEKAGVINYKTYHQNSSRPHFPINKEVKKNLSRDTFKQYIRHIRKYHIDVEGSWNYREFESIIDDGLNKLKDRNRSIDTLPLIDQPSVNDIQDAISSTQSVQQQPPLSGLPFVSSTQSAQQQASLIGQPSINDIQGTVYSTQPVQQQASLPSSQPFINGFKVPFPLRNLYSN